MSGDNDRGWKASFDWLLENDSNIMKVLEGNYPKNKSVKDQYSTVIDWVKDNEEDE